LLLTSGSGTKRTSGRIRKSIANDPFAGSQRRKNRTLHVIIARSREQHGFDIGAEWCLILL
jgi:hypothetical protein